MAPPGTASGTGYQLSLELDDTPIARASKQVPRWQDQPILFFAILPDAATVERIGRLCEELQVQHGLTGRPLPGDRLHVGLGPFRPSFTPHLTLRYDRAHVAATPVRPVAWTVREFTVVHSFRGQGRHVHVGRWPLGGATPRLMR